MATEEKSPALKPRTLSELSKLQCEYFTCPLPGHECREALIVRFSGECGYGSGCDNACAFMCAMAKAGLAAFEPAALVLDFANLGYEWGDRMAFVIDAGSDMYVDAAFPTAVVVSDRNRKGLTSFVEKEMGASPSDWLFESVVQALDAVGRKHKKTFPRT